jgi:biopolymer transport protein ExbB
MQLRRSLSNRTNGLVCAALLCAALLSGQAQAQSPGADAAVPVAPAPAGVTPSAPASSAGVATAAAPSEPAAAAPGEAAPSQGSPITDVASALLPRDLTPWGMFMAADVVVKAVMIGLVFASVLTWTIWLAKSLELFGARRRLRRAHEILEPARSLAEVAKPASQASPQVARLIAAVETELCRAPDFRDTDGIKERIAARFERIEAGVGRQMLRGTSILATIGATAPFVGLFGTVWGIMNSFIGISKLHTTNLAVVAPGIAEALLATAFGLAAAIPAVVIYNMFSRSIAQYRALYADTSVEIMTLVSRDLVQRPERYPVAVSAAE